MFNTENYRSIYEEGDGLNKFKELDKDLISLKQQRESANIDRDIEGYMKASSKIDRNNRAFAELSERRIRLIELYSEVLPPVPQPSDEDYD